MSDKRKQRDIQDKSKVDNSDNKCRIIPFSLKNIVYANILSRHTQII